MAAAALEEPEEWITREMEREPEKSVLKAKELFKKINSVKCSSLKNRSFTFHSICIYHQ